MFTPRSKPEEFRFGQKSTAQTAGNVRGVSEKISIRLRRERERPSFGTICVSAKSTV